MDDIQTNINLIGFMFTLTMGILMLFLPRRFAAFPLIMTSCFITLGQVIHFASMNFTMFRIIIFFGLVRVFLRKELFSIRFHRIDTILISYVMVSAMAYIFLRNGSGEAIINQLGFICNTLFVYIVFRSLIRGIDDIYLVFKMLAIVVIPLSVAMIVEKVTGRNIFSIFGGVSEFTVVRDGRMRCQGAFAHPILAGTFGATTVPLLVALWFQGKNKWLSGLGIISATFVTIAASSSGPVLTYLFIIIGLGMWFLRDYMRTVRWCILLSLIALHIVMKAPVWALIGKASEIIGGTGWHRVMLIDAAINHFGEWWLLGTDFTRHWLPTGVTWSPRHTDITNHFIGVGIHGGLISLILFIGIIVFSFKYIGIKLKEMGSTTSPVRFAIWCVGVALFGHIVSFTSVRYFDQIIVFWYLILALVATISTIPVNQLLSSSSSNRPGSD